MALKVRPRVTRAQDESLRIEDQTLGALRLFRDRLVLDALPKREPGKLREFCRDLSRLLGLRSIFGALPWLDPGPGLLGQAIAAKAAALDAVVAPMAEATVIMTLDEAPIGPADAAILLEKMTRTKFLHRKFASECGGLQDRDQVVLVLTRTCLKAGGDDFELRMARLEALASREPRTIVLILGSEGQLPKLVSDLPGLIAIMRDKHSLLPSTITDHSSGPGM